MGIVLTKQLCSRSSNGEIAEKKLTLYQDHSTLKRSLKDYKSRWLILLRDIYIQIKHRKTVLNCFVSRIN